MLKWDFFLAFTAFGVIFWLRFSASLQKSKREKNMRPSSTLRSSFCALAGAAISLAILPSSTFGLATFNNSFGLPAGLQNDIVRIGETEPGKTPGTTTGFVGTGTIIYTQPDSSGGNWYDI